MSLSKLPPHLIAQIADYLDFSVICNLMETNIKNHNAIKGYKKDKIKLSNLAFYNSDGRTTMNATGDLYQEYFFLNWEEMEENVEKVKQVLDKCSSIGNIYFGKGVFKNELFNVLMNTKTKIGALRFHDYFTKEEKVKLGQKYCIVFMSYGDRAILNDEFLTQILPRSSIMNWSGRIEDINNPMPITDCTIDALISGNKLQKRFFLENVYNYITIKKVAEVIKILQNGNYEWAGVLVSCNPIRLPMLRVTSGKMEN